LRWLSDPLNYRAKTEGVNTSSEGLGPA